MWVFLVGFIDQFGGAGAPLFGGIAMFSQYCEKGEDNAVCFLGKVLKDLVR